MPFKTYVCFFEKTEQGWKFQKFLKFFILKNLDFSLGGALITVFTSENGLDHFFE